MKRWDDFLAGVVFGCRVMVTQRQPDKKEESHGDDGCD
jgi:hypothetical protein